MKDDYPAQLRLSKYDDLWGVVRSKKGRNLWEHINDQNCSIKCTINIVKSLFTVVEEFELIPTEFVILKQDFPTDFFPIVKPIALEGEWLICTKLKHEGMPNDNTYTQLEANLVNIFIW